MGEHIKNTNLNEITDENINEVKMLIDESQSYIYVCDINNYNLLYANKRLEQLTNKSLQLNKEVKCYEYLKDRSTPCEKCYIQGSEYNNYVIREYTSDKTGKHYLARGRLCKWCGKEALVEYLTEETERINNQREINNLINHLPGGIGIYHYYKSGKLDMVYLNDGYYKMLGTTRTERKKFNNRNYYEAVHPDDLKCVLQTIKESVDKNIVINVDVRVLNKNDEYIWLNIRGDVISTLDDRYVIYTIYNEIDELKRTRISLETTKKAIELATMNVGISIWLFDINQRKIVAEFQKARITNNKEGLTGLPYCLIGNGDVFPEDEDKFINLYNDLFQGKSYTENIIRMKDTTYDRYEWLRISYTVVHDENENDNIAIGLAVNIDKEQEEKQKYEHELILRNELLKEAIISYEVNLHTGIIEKYNSIYNDVENVNAPILYSDSLKKAFLDNIHIDDRDKVFKSLLYDGLVNAYNKGEKHISLEYRRMIPGVGYHFVRNTTNIITNPQTNEPIAFLFIKDVDTEVKDRNALECITKEEIESLLIVKVNDGIGRFVKIYTDYGLVNVDSFVFEDLMQNMISMRVITSDKEKCEDFFTIKSLTSKLSKVSGVKIIYGIKDNSGIISRKRTRAFYLDSSHQEIVLIRQDITALYEEEEKKKLLLEKAVLDANEANKAKSDFLSRMSHDIRTPLNAILALSSEEMLNNLSKKELLDYLGKIHTSGYYLLGLINDILDMSKIESKKLVLNKEEYTKDMFRRNIDTIILEQSRAKDIDFVFDTSRASDVCILVDIIRFNQIFINLLSNAVKFTPNGGRIDFIVEDIEENDLLSHKRFTVKDNGVGMSKEYLPHAFESFTQEEKNTFNIQGTGLGLAIVKQLVEMMNGTIRVESTLNEGTTFIVDLIFEVVKKSYTKTIETSSDLSKLKDIRILLCEDNELNREILKSLLCKRGIDVDCAENGLVGVEMYQNSTPFYYDIVLMDIRMPLLNGIEAIKRIRALDRDDAKKIPIIALTADAFYEDIKISFAAGMNDHITKPIDPKSLLVKIASHL